MFIPSLLLLQPVIDKNMPLSSGELNTAEFFSKKIMGDATMCYWGGGGRVVSVHTLANLSKDRDKQSFEQLFPHAEHPDRN